MSSPRGRRMPPWPAVVAALALAAVAVLLGVLAVGWIGQIGTGAVPLAGQVLLVVLMVLAAAWAGLTAFGVWTGRGWARSGMVVIGLFAVLLSAWSFSGADPAAGWTQLVIGALVLVPAFSAPVLDHLGPSGGDRYRQD